MTQEFAKAQAEVLHIYRDALIEKACEWLRNNWRNYVVTDYDTRVIYFEHWENDFCKAMKED